VSDDAGFLSRWSRRKAQVAGGANAPAPAPALSDEVKLGVTPLPVAPEVGAAKDGPAQAAVPAPALPTMEDVAQLTRGSDYSRFVAPGVDEGVKRAAMKKLFSDPHFNVMDGLDTYIDDYGKPDPIPLAMLRQMAQAQVLGLFDHEKDGAADKDKADPGPQATPQLPQSEQAEGAPPDEDPNLRLQQDDVTGRSRADSGAGPAGV
jgi:hypothetical protein